MDCHAVIGMNYGDEGKGHITNFLAKSNSLNIRFNGGSQAAHCVVTNDGREHSFSHFGSASFKGARTVLTRKFIVNPLVFIKEYSELVRINCYPEKVMVDPRCIITTPYDMLINEFDAKYHKKNDTCGLGIYETIKRNEFKQLSITVSDVVNLTDSQILDKMTLLENEYLPYRIKKLGIPEKDFKDFCTPKLLANKFDERFLEFVRKMIDGMGVFFDVDVIEAYQNKYKDNGSIVFEASQGMLISEDRDLAKPFITPSKTGPQNILEIQKDLKDKFDINYHLVTRCYYSRHGDGPVLNPVEKPYEKVVDPTNPVNDFQGKIRYGYLDQDTYYQTLSEVQSVVDKVDIAMTCLDQLDTDKIKFTNVSGKMVEQTQREAFPEVKIISTGRSESKIKFI